MPRDRPKLPPESRLRRFKDVDDLFDSGISNETILEWVNFLAELLPEYRRLEDANEQRKGYHKAYQERRKLLMQAVNSMLDPDEKERIKKLADARAAGKEDPDA